MNKDFYTILGIPRSAPKDDVKKAFHVLARKYHPDNKDTGDEARFKEINEAYQTLSDDKKRAEYDAYGHVFSGGRSEGGGASGFGGFGNSSAWQDIDFGEIFSEFFGGGAERARSERGRDISVDLTISFEESIFGAERSVLLAKASICEVCSGSGAEKGAGQVSCASCNGSGHVRESHASIFGTLSSVRECSHCHGAGKIPKVKCGECRGLGVLKKQEDITIRIPSGINDGEVIRLSGMGEAISRGGAGDLYTRIHVAPHPVFRRDGNNLMADLNIKISDALLGAEYELPLLEGGKITLKVPIGVSFGEKLRVRGKGVPLEGATGRNALRGRRGDLLVRLSINMPKHLSRKARKLIEEAKEEGL